jgi:hypothetical protein
LGTLSIFFWKKVDFEMDQSQRELRRAANQAFMESLNHLGMKLQVSEDSFDSESEPPVSKPSVSEPSVVVELPQPLSSSIDLEDLEDAAADIEEYMKTLGGEGADPAED